MRFPRSCGTLVHPTSFPGKYGIGDLGFEARNFIDFLEYPEIRVRSVPGTVPTSIDIRQRTPNIPEIL